jgi:hypothetical protein
MPTDIVLVLRHKTMAEAQAYRDLNDQMTIVCLWSALGLVLTALMFNLDFGSSLAEVSAIAG